MELFPIVSGIALGAVHARRHSRLATIASVAIAVGLGIAATVLSGEFRLTWDFLLIDIPLVTCTAAATSLLIRRVTSNTRPDADLLELPPPP